MRGEVVVLLGVVALVTLMVLGFCGEVAEQTLVLGDSGLGLVNSSDHSGLNGAMPSKHMHGEPGEVELIPHWCEKQSDLLLLVRAYALPWVEPVKDYPVVVRVTYYDTFTEPWIVRDSWDFSGITNGDGYVKFKIKDAQVGT